MNVLSIQVGQPQTVVFRGREVTTGIFKSPVLGPVMVRHHHLDGDGQADLRVHGGADKAVYAYALDAYTNWQLRRPNDVLAHGAFGENLTLDVLPEDGICLGDKFRVGDAILQAVQPRMPCYKLGVKFNDPSVLRLFIELGRPGVYFKVLQEGAIESGQSLEPLSQASERISIYRIFCILRGDPTDDAEIARILSLDALPDQLRGQLQG